MLFGLRFSEESEKLNVLCGDLETFNIGKETIKMVIGLSCRKKVKANNKYVAGMQKAIKGLTQVFSKPQNTIVKLVQDLMKGKVDNTIIGKLPTRKDKFKTVIVFVVGGGTYGEACEIINLKKDYPNTDFFYGSSHFSTIQE
jgi:hypothetical protein